MGGTMTTLVVLSDTHGNHEAIDKLSQIFEESDYIIHLGDVSSDMRGVASRYPQKTYRVIGNCDFSYEKDEMTLEVEGHRIFFCHGHKYGVKSDLKKLVSRAKELGCDIALYGHTHEKKIEEIDGVLTINPGCLTRYTLQKSYCYLCIHKDKVVPTLVDLA